MALEDLTGPSKFIDALVNTNPNDGDRRYQGAAHIRGVKNVLLNSFPLVASAVNATGEQIERAALVDPATKANLAGAQFTGGIGVLNANPTIDTVDSGAVGIGSLRHIDSSGYVSSLDFYSSQQATSPGRVNLNYSGNFRLTHQGTQRAIFGSIGSAFSGPVDAAGGAVTLAPVFDVLRVGGGGTARVDLYMGDPEGSGGVNFAHERATGEWGFYAGAGFGALGRAYLTGNNSGQLVAHEPAGGPTWLIKSNTANPQSGAVNLAVTTIGPFGGGYGLQDSGGTTFGGMWLQSGELRLGAVGTSAGTPINTGLILPVAGGIKVPPPVSGFAAFLEGEAVAPLFTANVGQRYSQIRTDINSDSAGLRAVNPSGADYLLCLTDAGEARWINGGREVFGAGLTGLGRYLGRRLDEHRAGKATTDGTGNVRVNFAEPMAAGVAVAVATSPDGAYFVNIANASNTGFDAYCQTNSGAPQAGTFQWVASGHA